MQKKGEKMPSQFDRAKYILTKNPKLLAKLPQKLVKKAHQHLHFISDVKLKMNQNKRTKSRQANNYDAPKRALIYVIYENESALQTYKVIFLAALAALSEKVLIVVNGDLSQNEIKTLSKYGQVELRENTGYDTAAFKYGILKMAPHFQNFDELLLVNDTNVGPMTNLENVFKKMSSRKLDFWGISYGEPQADFTGYNPYGTIPEHLQSYFLVIEKNMFQSPEFLEYWKNLTNTDSRNKAIGKHETVFTKYFSTLGFTHGAVSGNNADSAMYIHPLTMLKKFNVPLVKYTAFANDSDDKFAWQGLERKTEVPELIDYIKTETSFPNTVLSEVIQTIQNKSHTSHILIIDGVENQIPQCTRYRVINKAEQLRSLGETVWTINASEFQMGYAEHASHIIIYRTPYSETFEKLIQLSKKYHKPIYYDIDDLVYDTTYTDQLDYVQTLKPEDKAAYDQGVRNYGKLMQLCDGFITSTSVLKNELLKFRKPVYLNRNLASNALIILSKSAREQVKKESQKVKLGYFSGSITHNENFNLIMPALLKILTEFPHVELHLVGHLTLPAELKKYKKQLIFHDYVTWEQLPALIAEVDINLAPLVDSIFNRAKSEIKWMEAALVGVPTLASNVGSFAECISDEETGLLVSDESWYDKLKELITHHDKLNDLAHQAHKKVLYNYQTAQHKDEMSEELHGSTETH